MRKAMVGWHNHRIQEELVSKQHRVAVLVVMIETPFGDVAVHVVKAPGVGLLLAHGMGLAVRIVREPGVVRKLTRIVAERKSRFGSGAAGVFPLRFGRQTV